jgi:hypothetical protein
MGFGSVEFVRIASTAIVGDVAGIGATKAAKGGGSYQRG